MPQARSKPRAKSASAKGRKRSKAGSGAPIWPWLAALVVVAGGIGLHDHFGEAQRLLAGLTQKKPVETAAGRPTSEPAKVTPAAPIPSVPVPSSANRQATRSAMAPDQSQTAAITPPGLIPPAPVGKPVLQAALVRPAEPLRPSGPSHQPGEALAGGYEGKFFLCGSAKQDDCVVSADRFVFHGQKIRLVGVEVPDIKKPHCEAERIKASDAELRVRAFLDSGPFELQTWQGNDAEIDGHKLRAVTRNGRSLADILVGEGLARRPGQGKGWCS